MGTKQTQTARTMLLLTTAAVVAVMALAPLQHVSAEDFLFNADACNTLFVNPANWRDGANPVQQDVRRIVLGPIGMQRWSPISTFVPADNYRTNEIVLAWDGQMEFDDNSVFEFSDDEDLTDAAYFVGGQSYREECDFHCHTNWAVWDNGTWVESERSPCAEDTAIFPEGYSYKVWMQGFTPVGQIQFAGRNLTSELQRRRIPAHQTFPEREDLDFFLEEDEGLYELCEEFGLFFNETCVCVSVCSSEEEISMFEMQQRMLAEERAVEENGLWSSNVTETFLTVYLPELIVNDPRILDVFETVFTDEFLPELERRLVAEVGRISNNPVVNFRTLEFDPRTSSVVLEGQLTTTYDFFHNIRTGVRTWPRFEVLDTTPSPDSIFSYAMWTVIVDYIDEVFAEECDSTINRQRQVCDALYGQSCSNIATLSEYFEPAQIANNFAIVVPDILAFLDQRAPGDDTPYAGDAIVDMLVRDDGVSRSALLDALASFFVSVDWRRLEMEGYDGSPVQDFVRLHKDCVSSPEAIEAINALDTNTLETHTVFFLVGRALPYPDVIDILRLQDRSFEDFICNTMHGRPSLLTVLCNSIVTALPATSRREAEPKNIGIEITLDYTIFVREDCEFEEISTSCPVVVGDNELYQNLLDILDAAVILFHGRARGKCVDYVSELGIDETCTKESAATALISALMEDLSLTLTEWSDVAVGDFSDSVGVCGTSCTINNQVADADYAASLVALKDEVRLYAFAAARAWLESMGVPVDDDFFSGEIPDDDLIGGTTTTMSTAFTTTLPGVSSTQGTTSTSSSSNSVDINSSSGDDQASFSLLFIIAGAAGGVIVLLLIVIIILLFKRNKQTAQNAKVERSFKGSAVAPASSKSADALAMTPRAALAFENPLYDDNDAVAETNINAAYDQDGLYDEPAELNRSARENPIYQSTDDLADDDEDEEGGYLDVQGEGEGGYLDVTPDEDE